MKQQMQTITGRIVVIHQGSRGIVAKVNGRTRLFQDRDGLLRAAVLLAARSVGGARVHPLPIEGV